MEALMEAMVKAIGMLLTCRYKTYSSVSDGDVLDMARLYSSVLSKDKRINARLIEATVDRYADGTVTVWQGGAHVKASREFPSPAEFRDACVQTWGKHFEVRAVGEIVNEDGTKVLVTKQFRKTAQPPTVLALDPPASPEQILAIKKRLEALPAMPSMSEAVLAPRTPRVYNAEAEADLARIRDNLRRDREQLDTEDAGD